MVSQDREDSGGLEWICLLPGLLIGVAGAAYIVGYVVWAIAT